MAAPRRVFVVGVGMTKFEKPGRRQNFDYPDMVKEAVGKALADAGLHYSDVEQACVGYAFGPTSCGQRALYEVGMTGIPVFNVNNACASGSSALVMARNFVMGGVSDCVLAVGFEKMERGPLTIKDKSRTSPMDKHEALMRQEKGVADSPLNPQMFGNAGREHMHKYGTKPEHFAKVAYKNHKHSVNNPYSQFQTEHSLDDILKSRMIYEPLTLLQCCPTSDGSGAVILASEAFVKQHKLEAQAVEIIGQAFTTDTARTFSRSMMDLVGYDMTKRAAEKVYKQAGITADDVDVIELHDCFAANELITYESLGLCPPGKAGEFIDRGDNTYGGKYVINPSGGLLSKGHPLGATGLAQCSELCWQLRGLANKRQVRGAKIALQHNIGLGGAAVLTLYKLGWPELNRANQIIASPASSDDFKASMVFGLLQKGMELEGKNYVKKINAIYVVKVKNGPGGKTGSWVIDAKNGNGSVRLDDQGKGDVTVTVDDDDIVKLMDGSLKPEQAFFQGKLKVAGNLALLMKLRQFESKARELQSKL